MESVTKEVIQIPDDDIQLIKDDLDSMLISVSFDTIVSVLDCYTELRETRLVQDKTFCDGDFTFSLDNDSKVIVTVSDSFRDRFLSMERETF